MAALRPIPSSHPALRGRCAGTDSAVSQRECRAERMTTRWCPRTNREATEPGRLEYTRLAIVATEPASCH
jgi:hypothetical protein